MTDQVEALIEKLANQVAEEQKTKLWSQFVPKHLKLHLAKQMVNYTVPRLNQLIPTRQPECLVSKIVDRTFSNLDNMVKLKKTLKDSNFTSLLETMRRTLIFIAEEDCYYRAWLEILFLTIYQDVKRNVPGLQLIDKQLEKERCKPCSATSTV